MNATAFVAAVAHTGAHAGLSNTQQNCQWLENPLVFNNCSFGSAVP